jgi:predicted nuclease of predicted toxin-antitoxin system
VRLLVDANLSPRIATALKDGGCDADHVADLGPATASDPAIFDRAEADGYAVVTADTDFPTLAALRRATSPSVVLLRGVSERSPAEHAQLVLDNLPAVRADLDAGAVVSLSPTYMRVRDLPIVPVSGAPRSTLFPQSWDATYRPRLDTGGAG